MAHIEDAPRVAQVHLIAVLPCEPEGERAVFGRDERTGGLEEAVQEEYREPATTVRALRVLWVDHAVHPVVSTVILGTRSNPVVLT
jgi:hypothetical protein